MINDGDIDDDDDDDDDDKLLEQFALNRSVNQNPPPLTTSIKSAVYAIWFHIKGEEVPWDWIVSVTCIVILARSIQQTTTTFLPSITNYYSMVELLLWDIWNLVSTILIGLIGFATFVISLCTYKFRNNRLEAHSDAILDYTNRLKSGRVIHTSSYELFLPPVVLPTSSFRLRKPSQALLFYPGLLVEHFAYAKILGQFSDRSKIPIVLINHQRWGRVVVAGVTSEYTNRIIQNVEQQLFCPSSSSSSAAASSTDKKTNIVIQEWIIGGHSMGAMICTELIKSPNLDCRIKRMVLWATTVGLDITTRKTTAACENNNRDDGLDDDRVILLINAEHDGVMETMNPNKEKFIKKLGGPNKVQHILIKGGNHDGFGNYGPQYYPHPDGARSISREQQQKEVLHTTIEFLQNHN